MRSPRRASFRMSSVSRLAFLEWMIAGSPAVFGELYLPPEGLDLQRTRRVVPVEIEADLAAGDDLGMLQPFPDGLFGFVGIIFRIVGMDAQSAVKLRVSSL